MSGFTPLIFRFSPHFAGVFPEKPLHFSLLYGMLHM